MAVNIERNLDFGELISEILSNHERLPLTTIISGHLRRNSFMNDMTGTSSDDIEKLKMAKVFHMIEELRPNLVTDYDRMWLKAILSPD